MKNFDQQLTRAKDVLLLADIEASMECDGEDMDEEGRAVHRDRLAVLHAHVRLLELVKECHSQKADDKCWMDVLKIYEAVGLPPPDKSVGDTGAMLLNCQRFVRQHCENGGPWKSYAALELRVKFLEAKLDEREREAMAGGDW